MDPGDADKAADNSVLVTLEPSEDDKGNDFVDSNNGSISGIVTDDNGDPIPGVTMTLQDNTKPKHAATYAERCIIWESSFSSIQ
jgi:hypothetical protein